MKHHVACLLTVAAVALALTCPRPATAQSIDITNALVVYFDEAATVRSWYGTGAVTAYAVAGPLKRWDGTSLVPCTQLESWWATSSLDPLTGRATGTWIPRGGGLPAAVAFAGGYADLFINLPTPLPLDGRTVVAELRLDVTSNLPTLICLDGWIYRADGATGNFATLTHGPDGPMDMTCLTAAINAAAPVPAERGTWGGVKAMFR